MCLGDFAVKTAGDFLVNVEWSPFPRKQSMKTRRKIRENSEHFSVQHVLDIFETLVTVTPNRNFRNFSSCKIPFKILNVYFLGDNVYFWGNNIYFWGNNVDFWAFSKIIGFWEFLFCCWGVLGLCGSGGPVGGFRKDLKHLGWKHARFGEISFCNFFLPVRLQKLVGVFVLIFCRDILWEIWREFCGFFFTHKIKGSKVFWGKFRSIFREKICSKARKPWSANRELRGWRRRGCGEGCQEQPEKGV